MNELPHLTINIASTGRPKRLADCLASIDYEPVQINIGAGKFSDVPSLVKLKPKQNIFVSFSLEFPVPVQNRLALSTPPYAHILPISDDIVFEPGAIGKAVCALQQFFPDGDGIVGFDIKNMREKDKCPYAYMLVGNKFFNARLGRVLFFERYQHFFADLELGKFAEQLGKFRICPEARLTHFHPSAGALADHTHLYHRQEKWSHDNKIYNDRQLGVLV